MAAAAAAATESQQLGDAIVAFSLEGLFPADDSSLLPLSEMDLGPAIGALTAAKANLETEIHTINEETRDDVSSWVDNAKTLQEDIIRSKTMANEIIRQSEGPDASGEAIEHAEEKVRFLSRELQYSQQLRGALEDIRAVNQLLGRVDAARSERRVLDSLRLLEQSWTAIGQIGLSKSCRILRRLDRRALDLKLSIHDVFDNVWKDLIRFDVEEGKVSVRETLPEGGMTLSDAVIGLKAYKETDERMEQLWRNLDGCLVSPRMDKTKQSPRSVAAEGDELKLTGSSDGSVAALLSDLETVSVFVAQRVPTELLDSLVSFMMPDLIPRLIRQWLNPAVPSSLPEIPKFQIIIQVAQRFCTALEANGYTGFDELKGWVTKSHMTWLGRCRESALDRIRTKLVHGIGEPRQVEKVEKHMVTEAEGKELATTGAGAAADTNDWGAAWDDDAWDDRKQDAEPPVQAKEDDGADAWGWDDEGDAQQPAEGAKKPEGKGEDDAGADAWGWGDEETSAEPESPKPSPKKQKTKSAAQETRELVLRETYYISSMPEPVLELIRAVVEDGASLTADGDKYQLVSSTAPGLFSLPTFVLALFRAISPHYYSLNVGGNMYLYNDAMYIAEQLTKFSEAWKDRADLTPRARNMLRLENDIKTLQNFANRSYANEMSVQRTVLQDLVGSSQSVVVQDDPEAAIESGVARIRHMATTWEKMLARSVWSQAIGSLVDALANRVITDVLDMPSIGQDEAYGIAKLIVTATSLDDLFLPSKLRGAEPTRDEAATTDQYAPNWPRLKYLGEVLQSDLNGIRALWCEQKLSYYFTVDEIVDLIRASFEENPRTRQTIKDIQKTQYPAVDL
ncbi:uncharacterized protein MAM_06466 [Metarhizium album ARSEF 1941]|uniref:ZW10 C-terminal helical domain-containing protein n=1 Tax=Metarhizium album (strain ARSEF 1941) TaxID=1081103 RepID=A0A0B2WRL3_METAS|nr:uncharacterized protein MAM_06466 [Metarhizium album ARSEF 1941]KHN95625.1 hypothetical protein MAM_06466 [Metarhizium album ARSEF 1941]